MVPVETSNEAPIHKIASKTEQTPANPNLVPVKSTQKRRVLLAIFVITVVLIVAAVFVGIFVPKHNKNRDKKKSQRK